MSKTLKIRHVGNFWFEGSYQGMFFQAKIFDEPSFYGINEGRVSKLVICDDTKWNSEKVLFSYDRGADVEHEVGYELAAILEKL